MLKFALVAALWLIPGTALADTTTYFTHPKPSNGFTTCHEARVYAKRAVAELDDDIDHRVKSCERVEWRGDKRVMLVAPDHRDTCVVFQVPHRYTTVMCKRLPAVPVPDPSPS